MATKGYSNGSYKLRGAFVNAAQLTAAYVLKGGSAWPGTSDMELPYWFNPEGSSLFNQAAGVEQSLYGNAIFTGDRNFTWTWPPLTPKQLDFLLYDATLFNGSPSMEATVETWNAAQEQWEIVWAVANIGIISDSGVAGYRAGLRSLTMPFLVKQDAP